MKTVNYFNGVPIEFDDTNLDTLSPECQRKIMEHRAKVQTRTLSKAVNKRHTDESGKTWVTFGEFDHLPVCEVTGTEAQIIDIVHQLRGQKAI